MNKLLIGSVITPDDITMYGLTPSKQINIVEGTLSSWHNVLRGIGQLPDYAKSDQSLAIYISNYNPVNINFLVKYVNVAHFKTDLDIQYIKNYKLSEQKFFEYRRRFDKQEFLREIVRDLNEANRKAKLYNAVILKRLKPCTILRVLAFYL